MDSKTMTKGELRAARKATRAAGKPLAGVLAVKDGRKDRPIRSEAPRGFKGQRADWERWARHYDELNGRPEDC